MKNMLFFLKKFRSLINHYLVISSIVAVIFATVYNIAFWSHVTEIYSEIPEIPLYFKVLTPVPELCILGNLERCNKPRIF